MADEVLDEELENSSSEEPDKKEKKKKEKKSKKEKKKANDGDEAGIEEEKDSIGSKIALFLVTLVILFIWLAIIALLIKADIGGFGSTVLYPKFKDVPYINTILPDVEPAPGTDEKYNFSSLEDAIDYVKELEKELNALKEVSAADAITIDELRTENEKLKEYKTEQEAFEVLRDKFYDDVLYYTSDQYDLYSQDSLVVLEAYRQYFEEIEPAKAESLYKQVITQIENADDFDDYVNKYANMKAKNAAAIFNEAESTEDLELVAGILNHMPVQNASDILAAMDTKLAFKLTYLLKPELR